MKKKKVCLQVLRKESLILLKFPNVGRIDLTSALIVSTTTKQMYAALLTVFSEKTKPYLWSKHFIHKNRGIRDIAKSMMIDVWVYIICVFPKYLLKFIQQTGSIHT